MIKKYRVTSETDGKTEYIVQHFLKTDKWVCDCPAYRFGKAGYECKHIKKVREYLDSEGKEKENG